MSTVDQNTLQWVKSEIDETLKQAQSSLEAYVEDTADESQMRFCINYLHQVHGTLQMVELHGAALAIEEMEKLSQAIFDDNVNNKDDAYEILMHGILQVPDYLEHLMAGNADMPVVLLPLLNDIRAARNEALLSEGALFTPDLNVQAPTPATDIVASEESNLSALSSKLRHNFHLGLLAWFQNKNPKAGLQRIENVVTQLSNAAESEEARRVFWIASALVESLKDEGVDTSIAVKTLMGHVDRQIKKIIDDGESALANARPEELEKNLLYYVANSTTSGDLTKDIKKAFKLKDIMPDKQAVEQARADLTAPNAALMKTVSSVIIEDINKVKDSLDMFVRADDKDMSVLEGVHTSLVQMGDTLAMLNLGVQRESVVEQAEVIGNIVSNKIALDENQLLDVAAALIAVENSLSEAPGTRATSQIAEGVDGADAQVDADQQKLMHSVLDEAKVNLAKVKDALTVFSQDSEQRSQLAAIPALLEQIHGSLMILSLTDAANLISLTNSYIRNKLINETIQPSLDDMNNLADAISSLEYYMESMMGSWGQPEAILNVAEQSLESLGFKVGKEQDESEATEEQEVLEEQESFIDIGLDDSESEVSIDEGLDLSLANDGSNDGENLNVDPGIDLMDEDLTMEPGFDLMDEGISIESGIDLADEDLSIPPSIEKEPTFSPIDMLGSTSEVALVDDAIDEEIIEIFIEEAEEAYESISKLLPLWIANTENHEPLKEIRRAYHTLKGSGRLVGALELGEFAWAFENMLNHLLDGTINISSEMIELMELGNQALPELFELFKVNEKAKQNILVLMEYADAISQGNDVIITAVESEISIEDVENATESMQEPELDFAIEVEGEPALELDSELTLPLETEEESSLEDISKEKPPIEIDATLLDIYRKEVAMHSETLKQCIIDWNSGNNEVSQVLLRALHTLTGSSRTTGVQSLAAVCSSFESHINSLHDSNVDLSQTAIVELEKTISLIEQTVNCLDLPGAELPEHETLLARIEALEVVTPEATQELNETPIPDAAPLTDYDEELLDIFIEEGTEILDASDHVIHDWIADPSDKNFVEELQRQLHTLKGGARMAGIAELGDLGHSVESLLTSVVDGQMQASRPMFDLVLRSQDRLVHMLDLVQDRKSLMAATDLLTEIDNMLHNRSSENELDLTQDAVVDESNNISDVSEIDISELESLSSEDIEEPITITEIEIPEIPENIELTFESEDLAIESDSLISLEPEEQTTASDIVEKDTAQEIISEKTETNLPVEDESDRRQSGRTQAEQVRVRADLLDNLVNFAGEVSIYRSRLEQQTNNFRYNITEFDDTVSRLREQLRQFEIETETQIEYKNEELSSAQENFDPLEMDRFTTMQHLSRAMMESLGDLDSLRGILNNLTRESETLLLQQSRVNTDLQEGLMRTRMVPFSTQAARLRRIVRQTCSELGKNAELHLEGVESEIDRSVLERILSPIEHMLRNAVAHGIETPEQRKTSNKAETGTIELSISNEGSNILIKIKDDGAGINLDAIREKAISKGLIDADAEANKDLLLEIIMQSGFSTAESVSQIAGRGVGMDVVNTEIKQLGGIFNIDTETNKGTTFTVSLPLTLAISRALMVNVADDIYAVPLLSVEGVERISAEKVKEILASENQTYNWVDAEYKFMHLGSVMGVSELNLVDDQQQLPMLMIRSGEHRAAILVDALLGSREIVVKSVGPQLSTLRGISGATVMGDGSVVLIIDLGMIIHLSAITEHEGSETPAPVVVEKITDTAPLVMVVDDSITVRKVTTRLLERHEMKVVAAKDGVDALSQLQEIIPDVMLLDVEMPRMDGFELATNMRNDERLKNIPIIMITSRTGQKHRDRATAIGVNVYLGKPYIETDLMDSINQLLEQVI